jgi:hypothetical protein
VAPLSADRLAPQLRAGLAELARRLDHHEVPFLLGGSAMLVCRGIDVAVGDLDIWVSRHQLNAVLAALEPDHPVIRREPRPPWQSAWLVRARLCSGAGSVAVDIIGDLAIEIGGVVARFPIDVDTAEVVDVDGWPVPIDSMWRWYHLYRLHDPGKAAQIYSVAGPGDLAGAAAELGL